MKRTLLAKLVLSVTFLACVGLASGVGTGGTGVYVRGALKSAPAGIVVDSITFDASQAAITINGQASGQGDLQPGMVAGVAGRVVPGQQQGTASKVGVTRSVLGVTLQVGTGGTGIHVAQVYVATRTDTVYSGVSSATDIAPGDSIDVYGYSDGVSGTIYATRIEKVAATPIVELHGIVATPTQNTFVLQGVMVDASNAQLVGFSGAIAAGDRVAVDGNFDAQNTLVATTITFEPDVTTDNGQEAEVEDAIGALLGASLFVVDDFIVDASHASFDGGTAADLAVGRVVQVEGHMVNGVLMASSVEFDDDGAESEHESDPSHGGGQPPHGGTHSSGEVEGSVSAISAPGVFTVGNRTVDARGARISGKLAVIRVGTRIEARGTWQNGVLMATRLSIDD
jgi:hypothetical protein